MKFHAILLVALALSLSFSTASADAAAANSTSSPPPTDDDTIPQHMPQRLRALNDRRARAASLEASRPLLHSLTDTLLRRQKLAATHPAAAVAAGPVEYRYLAVATWPRNETREYEMISELVDVLAKAGVPFSLTPAVTTLPPSAEDPLAPAAGDPLNPTAPPAAVLDEADAFLAAAGPAAGLGMTEVVLTGSPPPTDPTLPPAAHGAAGAGESGTRVGAGGAHATASPLPVPPSARIPPSHAEPVAPAASADANTNTRHLRNAPSDRARGPAAVRVRAPPMARPSAGSAGGSGGNAAGIRTWGSSYSMDSSVDVGPFRRIRDARAAAAAANAPGNTAAAAAPAAPAAPAPAAAQPAPAPVTIPGL